MNEFTILQDDREKAALDFSSLPVEVKIERLEIGDYTTPALQGVAAIELKHLNDLATCCGTDRKRFERQVQAGAALSNYAVVIDSPRDELELYGKKGVSNCPLYYSKIHPNAILGTVDKWGGRYEIDFVWVQNEFYAAVTTYNRLSEWNNKVGNIQ